MRSSMIRRGWVAALFIGLLGAGVASPAAAETEPGLEQLVKQLDPADAPTQPAPGPLSAAVADTSLPQPEWDLFRYLNLLRIEDKVGPVIRRGALDDLAGTWASTQAQNGTTDLDPMLESKLPAGWRDGIELLYSWEGTDVEEFLYLVAEELWWDGTQANMTDSGIAIARAPFGLIAYVLLLDYPHSTAAAGELPLYRFYKPTAGTHFYSTSAGERNTVIGMSEYRYEGLVAYIKSPSATSTSPLRDLNRFYLSRAGTHFYTSSPTEYQAVLTYPQYSLDGVAGRVHAAPGAGLSAMHRFYRPASGTHFYTANGSEVEAVKKIPGYTYEGVAFYLRVAS